MDVTFWGVRGSLPASMRSEQIHDKLKEVLKHASGRVLDSDKGIEDFINSDVLPFWATHSFGGNTPCVQIEHPGNEYIFCDAGTGIRDFAHWYMSSKNAGRHNTFHFFLSHLHWDHIMGFPFFAPAYAKGNRIVFHGYHEEIPEAIRTLMSEPFFPVPFSALGAEIEFDIRDPEETFEFDDFQVKGMAQTHPGTSYGYRFEMDDKVIVYSTDCEHKKDALWEGYPFHEFYGNADLLIFDGQYTMLEAASYKEDWGHSSNMMGVELAAWAKAKHLVIFHLEHTSTDRELESFLEDTIRYRELNLHQNKGNPYPQIISLAYDGMKISL